MNNKIKNIILIGFTGLLLFSSQVNAYSKHSSNTCENGSCSQKNKELTPAQIECIKDVRSFVFSYGIIRGMHEKYEREFGSIPSIVQQDLKNADSAYYEMQKYAGSTKLLVREIVNFATIFVTMGWGHPEFAIGFCEEMYNQEMNKLFNSDFSPTSNDPFLTSNWVCHTSYQDALKNIQKILQKYRNGQPCE